MIIALVVNILASAPRRVLQQSDLAYGLDAFNERFGTRAPALFARDADRFHRRLFEHEASLPHDRLQTFVATLHGGSAVTAELRQTLEEHADLTLHAVVGGDLLLHATRGHADALREAAPVRAVVPLLPELKVSPHFFALLPARNTTPHHGAALVIRLVPLENHAHLRRPAAALSAAYAEALTAACAAEGVWKARRACAGGAAEAVDVRAESERTLVVDGVEHGEALAVAELMAGMPETLCADGLTWVGLGWVGLAWLGWTWLGWTHCWQRCSIPHSQLIPSHLIPSHLISSHLV
jgi:hypothetical protein